MSETLHVQKRTVVGSLASRRLRAEGRLPAVLYGHQEEAISLSIAREELDATLRHGAKVVQLAGDLKEQALLQDLQWDTFGRYVLHADLLRVSQGERVTVEVEVAGKGEAAGEKEGGILTWINHTVEIEVTPANVPEKLHIDLTPLTLGHSLTAGNVMDLPGGASLVTPADRVLVNCIAPAGEEPEESGLPGSMEPEMVSKKKKEEEAE